MDKYKMGSGNFLDQAIKISGGIIPRKDSETKNIAKTLDVLKVSVIETKIEFKSIIK